MEAGFIIAIFAGLLAMLGWGTSDFFAKKSVDKVGHIAALFWMQALGIIPLLLLFLIKRDFSGINTSSLTIIAVLGLIDVLGYLFFYKALEKGKVSVVGPIVASYSAFSVIIAALFLGERLSIQTIFILLVIFAGILITSTDFEELKKDGLRKEDFAKGVPEAILGVLFFSIWFPFWDNFVGGQNWIILVLILRVFMSLMLLLGLKFTKKAIVVRDKKVFRWLMIIGLLDAAAYAALTWGYGVTSYVSIITVLSATFSIPTLILARMFLKEKLQKAQIFGIGIILLGIAALAIL